MRYDAVQFLESLFRPDPNPVVDDTKVVPATRRAVFPADLPADWFVTWDERAAIMEYDGGLHREHAEHHALLEVQKMMNASR